MKNTLYKVIIMYKFRRILSLLMAITMAISMNVINIYATATSSEAIKDTSASEEKGSQSEAAAILGDISTLDSTYPNVVVELPNAGDSKTIDMQIDHSLYPTAMLFAYIYGGKLGDVDIKVNGTSIKLNPFATGGSSVAPVKSVAKITGSGVKNYTITVSTTQGNASCALNLGTEATFAESFGGVSNVVSVAKNQPYNNGVTWFNGRKLLLNGDGEWFQYTADGDTYIFASALRVDDLVISVQDADTRQIIDKTGAGDIEIDRVSSTLYTGCVQKLFKLQSGHDYLIQVTAASAVSADVADTYNISIGLPSIIGGKVDYTSSSSYSIPANISKTFTFQVSGQPKSSRLSTGGSVSFRPSSAADKVSITSCEIVAPNGKSLSAQYGEYSHNQPVNFENYLTSFNNIPINGTWMVTIKSSKAISGLKFKINGNTYHIAGKDGN